MQEGQQVNIIPLTVPESSDLGVLDIPTVSLGTGIAFDANMYRRVSLKSINLLIEQLNAFVRDLGAVELKIDRRRDRCAIRSLRFGGAICRLAVGCGLVGVRVELRVRAIRGFDCCAVRGRV